MPPRDYVARSKPRARKKPPKKPFPWLLTIITCVVFAGFFWLLSIIQGAAPDKPTALENAVNTPKKVKKSDKPLPVLEKDTYGFPTDLEKAYQQDRLPTGEKIEKRGINTDRKYIMQCGSFRSEQQAKEMEAIIAFQGLDAHIKATKGSKGLWHRVYLGPYQQKRHADVDKHKIESAGIFSCRIWNWNL